MKNILSVQWRLKEKNADAFFVSHPVNIFYLTGFRGLSPEEREVSLLITHEQSYLFIPKMYQQQAQELSRVKDKTVELQVLEERGRLMTAFVDFIEKDQTLLVEDTNFVMNEYQQLETLFQGKIMPANGLIEEMRMIKTPEEIEMIKKAVALTDQTLNETISFLKSSDYTRLTENDLADHIRSTARKLGGEGLSFDTIVASGAGSAEPHYFTANKKLQKGELVLFDLGVKYEGYCGDLTRCVTLGLASSRQKEIYNIVRACNEKSIAACRPGITEDQLYTVANDFLKSHELDQYFLHGLGHAIGLAVHEEPYLRKGGTRVLEPGICLTIEPGVYFAHEFGIRVEDFVIVTDQGCEVLSTGCSKDLIEI